MTESAATDISQYSKNKRLYYCYSVTITVIYFREQQNSLSMCIHGTQNKQLFYSARFIGGQEINGSLKVSPQAFSVAAEIRMQIIRKYFLANIHLKNSGLYPP